VVAAVAVASCSLRLIVVFIVIEFAVVTMVDEEVL
jgi:hypothetical protein